jgi:hypothetical protein
MTDIPLLPWITDLRRVLGLHEVRDNAALRAYLRSDGGKTLGDPKKLPWCGDAVDTSMFNALPNEPRPGALGQNPYWARNWALFGVEGLYYGSVLVFVRKGGGHVGYAMGITPDRKYYLVMGGNQGDTVSVKPIAVDRCIAARWPSTSKHPKVLLPKRAMNGAASTNEA